jgi:type VI secretion system protein ImpF
MAELFDKRHVSPPLMHVFRAAHEMADAKKPIDIRNEAGERMLADRRMRPRQVITETVLRREVARDLDALLNAISMEASVDMSGVPHVRRSILNFGLADVSSRTIDGAEIKKIPDEIRTAVINYEPRLAPGSLHIERDKSVDPEELKIRFIVRADLTCHPVHVPVEFVADIVESGKILVNRLSLR